MRRHFALRDLAVLARRLHRSVASVRARARLLFRRRRKGEPWSEADDLRLRASFGVTADADVALGLGRSVAAVRVRVDELRRAMVARPWTAADDQRLRRVYGSRDAAALELCLCQTEAAIEAAAIRLCLRKDRRFLARQVATGQPAQMPRWSEAAVAELRRLYPTLDNLELARRLGRSVVSIANKANQLGLHKRRQWLARVGSQHVRRRWQARATDGSAPE